MSVPGREVLHPQHLGRVLLKPPLHVLQRIHPGPERALVLRVGRRAVLQEEEPVEPQPGGGGGGGYWVVATTTATATAPGPRVRVNQLGEATARKTSCRRRQDRRRSSSGPT